MDMKNLILMRHAKSSWNHPELDDHARPLNQRGRAAAKTMANWFVTEEIIPDYALVSDAVRTQETWEIVSDSIGSSPEADISRELYLAAPQTMLAAVQSTPADANTLMLIAHQPGTSILASILADGTESDDCKQAYQHYPTAGVSVFQFEIETWNQLGAGSGKFIRFETPKRLS